ncbi:MAG: hypothetical protein Q9178_004625 [Gyalolechia marmorata]
MRVSSLPFAGVFFSVLVASQRLTKPPLQQNLDNLKQGLVNNLKVTPHTKERLAAGWMPARCKVVANEENLNPADFQVWRVRYNDCSEPWVMCYHKNSPKPLNNLVNTFGRLPVHTRDYVRHVISAPSPDNWAYIFDASIVFFGNTLDNLAVHLHETGHALDLGNAYPAKPLSSSDRWRNAYQQDSAVPDPYSQTNQVENVAQNTVVASFHKNVNGGFPGVNPNSRRIVNQYSTVVQQQKEGGDLLIPGGKCRKRLPNNELVPVGGNSRVMGEAVQEKPDVSIKDSALEVMAEVSYDTREACNGTVFT